MRKIAVIRIAGIVRKRKEIEDTLNMLRLKRKYSCIVVEDTKQNMGMIEKVKDFVTYGEIDDDTLKLLEKRAKINKEKNDKTKAFFRLSPPKGGFERKGTKVPFKLGGALGFRGEKINDLIRRMM